MTPDFMAALEATWPPAKTWESGPWRLRDGAGGGKRVSAATLAGDWGTDDLATAEQAMAPNPLFMIRQGETPLDDALSAQGYRRIDPTLIYAATVLDMQADLPPLACFPHWPPLEIARDLWAEGGIGPARLAVMDRVSGPKTAILARSHDRVAGVGFVACHGTVAMLHALEVAPAQRRRGAARTILQAAANWAAKRDAATLALAVTEANSAACALYTSLGMLVVGQYHYRQR